MYIRIWRRGGWVEARIRLPRWVLPTGEKLPDPRSPSRNIDSICGEPHSSRIWRTTKTSFPFLRFLTSFYSSLELGLPGWIKACAPKSEHEDFAHRITSHSHNENQSAQQDEPHINLSTDPRKANSTLRLCVFVLFWVSISPDRTSFSLWVHFAQVPPFIL